MAVDVNATRRQRAFEALTGGVSRSWRRESHGRDFRCTLTRPRIRNVGGSEVFSVEVVAYVDGRKVYEDRLNMPNPPLLVVVEPGDPERGIAPTITEDAVEAIRKTVEQVVHVTTRGFQDRRLERNADGSWRGDTLAVRAGTGDGRLQSSNSTFATMCTGSSLTADTTATSHNTTWNFFLGSYNGRMFFMPFDTSSLGSSAVISAAVFTMYANGAGENDTNGYDAEIRYKDFGTLTTADWFDPRSGVWSGLPLGGSFDVGSWVQTAGTANNFSDSGVYTAINKTGTTDVVLGLSGMDNSTPTGLNSIDFYTADRTGTSEDPLLTITYTTGTAHSAAASLAAAGAVTAAGRRGAQGAASVAGAASVTATGERGTLASASVAAVGSVTAAGSVGLDGATALQAVASLTATPDSAKLGAASLSASAAITASALLTLQGAAALAAAAALTATASAGRGGVASIAGIAVVTAAGSVGLEGAASLTGIAVVTANGSIVVFFDIGLNARPRLYIHDGETMRRLAELTDVSSINRDFALREHVRQAEFDIAWSHPDGALTDDERGNVLFIESPEYPSPWVGRIVTRRANHAGRFWTVYAESYEAILGERVLDTEFATTRGRASTVARQILARVNGINATGIEMGGGEDTDVPPLALANILGIEALERMAENAGMEWWLSYEYDAGAVRVFLNVGRERGTSFYDRVVLRQPGNFEIADSQSSNRNRVYAMTVVGGQASPSTTFAERERAVAVRDGQFSRGDSSAGVHIVEGARLTRHGHVIGGESSYRAPTQRRERLLVLEELKAQGVTREVAEARLTRQRPPRTLVGRAYPDVEGTLASSWKYLEPGNVLHLVSEDAFGVGYDGPAVVVGVQPMEHMRWVHVVLEVG
ncbi:MAG: hypothetical protein AB7L91_06245 [Dehalococcoidia bacterium]